MDKNKKLFADENYRKIFQHSPAAQLIIDVDDPVFTILDVNHAYLVSTHSKRNELVGKPVFAAFPANPSDHVSKNIERTIFSFQEVIRSKKPHIMSNYRYDIPIHDSEEFEERYWTTTNIPILNEEGEVDYFIHSPANVTELNKLAEREKQGIEALKQQRAQLYSTFMQAPIGIGIFKGPDFIVDMINPQLCELYGKTAKEMIGKPVFDVLNSARGYGFEELLEKVRVTGISSSGESLMVPLEKQGRIENVYVDFAYVPLREDDNTISGVIALATDVTSKVQVTSLVEEAEERARLAVDAVGLGTFDLNYQTAEIITSMQFARIFGLDEPVSLFQYLEKIYLVDVDVKEKANNQLLETGFLEQEFRITWPDESVHWVKAEGKLFFNEEKKPSRILGTLIDITETRQAKEDQRKLITLVDNSVDLMSVLKMDGKNSYINEAGRNMLGLDSDEQVLKVPISELHTKEDYDFVQKEVIPIVMEKGSWNGIMKLKNFKTGEVFPVSNNSIRIDDPYTGKPIGVGAIMRDLRKEIKAKQDLEASEEFLRTVTTAAPTALWTSDTYGLMTYVNQTWVEWTSIPFERNLGFGWLKAIAKEDRQRVDDQFKKDFEARSVFEVEFRMKHKDKTTHWCVLTGKPQYKEGNFAGYIGACVDITEQIQMQQQKDNFIAIASHELKTPVTTIKAYTQVLEMMMTENGHTKEAVMVGKMDLQLNRLIRLISDLLEVTKINAGKLQFNDDWFDFNGMVKEMLEELQRTTEKHKIVAKLGSTGLVFADKERISQVVTNFITNAIKYSPESSDIIVHTYSKDNEVILCVEDFGIGIGKEDLEKVFEQFYRVSGEMQHTFPGLGLGLYISSEIVKRENGRIWAHSIPGHGTTFGFALPVKDQ